MKLHLRLELEPGDHAAVLDKDQNPLAHDKFGHALDAPLEVVINTDSGPIVLGEAEGGRLEVALEVGGLSLALSGTREHVAPAPAATAADTGQSIQGTEQVTL